MHFTSASERKDSISISACSTHKIWDSKSRRLFRAHNGLSEPCNLGEWDVHQALVLKLLEHEQHKKKSIWTQKVKLKSTSTVSYSVSAYWTFGKVMRVLHCIVNSFTLCDKGREQWRLWHRDIRHSCCQNYRSPPNTRSVIITSGSFPLTVSHGAALNKTWLHEKSRTSLVAARQICVNKWIGTPFLLNISFNCRTYGPDMRR